MQDDAQGSEFGDVYWRRSGIVERGLDPLSADDIDETEFKVLADNLPSLCWIANADGAIVWYNRRWHDYCGSTPADMMGWGWQAVHDPNILPDVMARWVISIEAGETFEMTFPLKGADGIFRSFLTRIVPLKDRSGRILRWFGNNTDISAQRQVETALRDSEQRLNLALSAGHGIGTWDWDIANDRVVADRRFATLYSVDPELAKTGAPIAEFFRGISEDDLPALRAKIDVLLQVGGDFSAEYRVKQPDGSVRWIQAQGQCILSAYGAPTRFPGVSFDITERKIAEEELRQLNQTLEQRVAERTAEVRSNETRLRAILETSHQYQGLIDLDGTVLFANAISLRGIESTAEHVVGKKFWDTPWFAGTPGMEETVRQAFSTALDGENVRQEIEVRLKSGTRWLDFAMRPILDDRGATIGIVHDAVDITERRQAEEALRQSQKMEAVGQLTGGLAHDFNNLLTGISGSLEIMQTRIAQGKFSAVDRYMSAAQGAAKRAAALTHRLLAFSRRQTLDPRPTDVNRLIADMEDLIRRSVGPATQIETVGAGGLWPTLVDPNQLENALLNLCINARDAMPDGGRITIETANKWLDERAAAERDLPIGQYVSLCVTDTGTGMTPEVVARAFDPFFTTKPLGEGTGLGLSMIYGFARQSGGQVRIYSEVGHGTTMCIYLPREHRPAEHNAPSFDNYIPDGGPTGEVVLVVDDEPTIRMLIVEVLEEKGYAAIEAGDGPTGLRVLQSQAKIDLLITDVGLPGGMNGRQVADAARVLRPDLKVLFITGYAENAVVGNGHLDPGMQIITKPFAMDALARKIQEIIQR